MPAFTLSFPKTKDESTFVSHQQRTRRARLSSLQAVIVLWMRIYIHLPRKFPKEAVYHIWIIVIMLLTSSNCVPTHREILQKISCTGHFYFFSNARYVFFCLSVKYWVRATWEIMVWIVAVATFKLGPRNAWKGFLSCTSLHGAEMRVTNHPNASTIFHPIHPGLLSVQSKFWQGFNMISEFIPTKK